jgi:hypothetical protein
LATVRVMAVIKLLEKVADLLQEKDLCLKTLTILGNTKIRN